MFQYKQPVLVVDEDAHMRALIASIMKNAGVADVVPASTVEDALREVHIRPPVAVITEANVSGRNGVALIDWLRRAPESPCPQTPALVLTGLASQSIVIRARDAGAHGVIAKPVAPDTLIRKTVRAISNPRRFVRSLRYVGPCRRVRVAEGYFGRRLDDDDDDPRLTTPEHCERLAAPVNALANCAASLDPTSRSQIIAVRNGARAVAEEARAAQDRPLTEAAGSLTGFVDACGLSGLLDGEVVDIHVATMRNLTNPERRRQQHDYEVIAGLHQIVARRLAEAGIVKAAGVRSPFDTDVRLIA